MKNIFFMEDPKIPKKILTIPKKIHKIPQILQNLLRNPKFNHNFQATILDLLQNLDQSQILNKEYQ